MEGTGGRVGVVSGGDEGRAQAGRMGGHLTSCIANLSLREVQVYQPPLPHPFGDCDGSLISQTISLQAKGAEGGAGGEAAAQRGGAERADGVAAEREGL